MARTSRIAPTHPPTHPFAHPKQRATTAVVGSKKALVEANEKLSGDGKLDVVELL